MFYAPSLLSTLSPRGAAPTAQGLESGCLRRPADSLRPGLGPAGSPLPAPPLPSPPSCAPALLIGSGGGGLGCAAGASPLGSRTLRAPRSAGGVWSGSISPGSERIRGAPQRRSVGLRSVLFCGERAPEKRRRGPDPVRGEMSNVRVSNGSPSLERTDARQAEHPKPSACRNLFGPVNHEELTRDLEKHCRDMEEASQRKWNFDFQNHKPLEGKYEWQEVDKGSLPEFYYRPPRPPKGACKVPAQESQDTGGVRPAAPVAASQASSEDTHLGDPKTEQSDGPTALAEQCAGMRKRPATDDSSPQNKRANRTEENGSDGSPNAGSVEQTPKKPGLRRRQT